MQSHTIPTYTTHSIHLGPCLDQHTACDLAAILGSEVERGALELRGQGTESMIWGKRGTRWGGGKLTKRAAGAYRVNTG